MSSSRGVDLVPLIGTRGSSPVGLARGDPSSLRRSFLKRRVHSWQSQRSEKGPKQLKSTNQRPQVCPRAGPSILSEFSPKSKLQKSEKRKGVINHGN